MTNLDRDKTRIQDADRQRIKFNGLVLELRQRAPAVVVVAVLEGTRWSGYLVLTTEWWDRAYNRLHGVGAES